MKYESRSVISEYRSHPSFTTYIRYQRHDMKVGPRSAQLAIDTEQRKFRALNQEKLGRPKACYLAS
jgi:hypothetical protein